MRPDLTIVASSLLLFVGEERTGKAGLGAALDDIKNKFKGGLSPMYYQQITFIPFMIAAGNQMRFGMLPCRGEVRPSCMLCAAHLQSWPLCQYCCVSRLLTVFLQVKLCDHTYDVTLESECIAIMQSSINLYRLLFVLDSLAPDLHLRRLQGVPEHRQVHNADMPLRFNFPQPEPTLAPCRPEDTIINRHRCTVEKIIHNFDIFLDKFGYSFEAIEVGWFDVTRLSAQPELRYLHVCTAAPEVHYMCREPIECQLVSHIWYTPSPLG